VRDLEHPGDLPGDDALVHQRDSSLSIIGSWPNRIIEQSRCHKGTDRRAAQAALTRWREQRPASTLPQPGLEPWPGDHIGYFAIRVGARRLADADPFNPLPVTGRS
jgi:hypothetical protein